MADQVTRSKPQVAIVTGAAQGLGHAIALRLAHDGYDIAASDLPSKISELESLVQDIKAAGRNAIAVPCDVSKESDVEQMVQRTVEELGQLRIMVANAGISPFTGPVVNLSLEQWSNVLTINLTGVFLCYRAAARQMLKQGQGGRIIGASSTAGKRGLESSSAYSASKFGVRGLTQSLASELAKEGITVNAYAPGPIKTPMVQQFDAEIAAATGQPVGWATATYIEKNVPVGKQGTPENVAALVSYLVSDQADFMTGQTLNISGGEIYD